MMAMKLALENFSPLLEPSQKIGGCLPTCDLNHDIVIIEFIQSIQVLELDSSSKIWLQ